MFVFQAESASVVFKPTELLSPELTLATIFAALLFGHRRHADGGEFIFVAVEVTGEAHAEFARIEPVVLAAALRVQTCGSDDQGVCPGGDQFAMQRIAKTAALVNGMHGVASCDSFFDPGDEWRASHLLGGLDRAVIALDGHDAEIQIDVDADLEYVLDRIGSWRICGIALAARDISVVIVVMGWDLFIHNKIKECEPVLLALVNPSWHLTRRSALGLLRACGFFCVFGPRGSAFEC